MKHDYYICRVGVGKILKEYTTLKSAQAESMRLAGQNPGNAFEILICVGITQTTTPQTFWVDGVNPEEFGL